MPNRTYAFSHKGGYWKTRYTFASSAYATLNKVFLGFNTVVKRVLTHIHNRGANTAFYGGAAAGSGIVVSFNDQPSANKIFKAVSLECTANVIAGSTAALVVNNSTTDYQAKASPLIAFDDKGGIVYGQIRGLDNISTANIKPVGAVLAAYAVTDVPTQIQFQMQWIDGGQGNVTSDGAQESSYIFNGPTGFQQPYNFFYADPAQVVNIANVADYSQFTGPVWANSGGNFLTLEFDGVAGFDLTAALNYFNPVDYTVHLYSITSEAINGDQLRGQIADAVFALGASDYELYALNLEYEQTTYDHSGSSAPVGITRGARSRRRK